MKNYTLLVSALVIVMLLSGCTPNPESVVKDMAANMAGLDSVRAVINVGIHGQFPQLTTLDESEVKALPGALIFNLRGPVDFRDGLAFDLTGSAKYRLEQSEVTFIGELIVKAAKIYFQLLETPAVAAYDFSRLKGNWYHFDLPSVGLGSPLADKEDALTAAEMNKIKKMVGGTAFFTVLRDNGEDILDGEPMFHYDVTIDKKELKKFFTETAEIIEENSLTKQEAAALDASMTEWEKWRGQIWISKKDRLLRRMEMNTGAEGDGGSYDLVIELDSFNVKAEVKTPENARPFNMLEAFAPGLEAETAE